MKLHELKNPFSIDCIVYHLKDPMDVVIFEPGNRGKNRERWITPGATWINGVEKLGLGAYVELDPKTINRYIKPEKVASIEINFRTHLKKKR